MNYAVAVDLGGTKLATAVVGETGQILGRKKSAVRRGSAADVAGQIAEGIAASVAESGIPLSYGLCAGVIVPGIYYAATGHVWAPNLWGGEKVQLREALEKALTIPVRLESDRAGYVLGEQWLGVAAGMSDVVFLAVGTGIGAGILSGGRLLRGAGDVAGAVGWFSLTPEHRDLYRQMGCWETEAAGPALARRIGATSAESVVLAARAGDASAREAIDEAARWLGRGIANIVSLLNPELVVLGGGLMQAHDLFLHTIRSSVVLWAQPIAAHQARIEPTRLGEDAGLLGAARIALEYKPGL